MDPIERLLPDGPGGDIDAFVDMLRSAGRAIEAVQSSRTDDGVDVQRKGDGSPVTAADLASHEILMEGLARLDPGTPVLGEESHSEGDTIPDHGWVVDPLDGTKEFIRRNGEYVINMGYRRDDRAVFGLVHVPQTGQTFVGGPGVGAWCKDPDGPWTPIRPAVDGDALRIVMSRSHRGPLMDGFLDALEEAGVATEAVPMGSAWKFLAVADGKADLYPRLGPTMWWDTLAPQAIAEGAGCTVTDLRGEPFRYAGKDLLNGFFCVHGRHVRSRPAVRDALRAAARHTA